MVRPDAAGCPNIGAQLGRRPHDLGIFLGLRLERAADPLDRQRWTQRPAAGPWQHDFGSERANGEPPYNPAPSWPQRTNLDIPP